MTANLPLPRADLAMVRNARVKIKSYAANPRKHFDKWDEFNIKDSSIGIDYGIHEPIPHQDREEWLNEVRGMMIEGGQLSRVRVKQIKLFLDIQPGDWIIIGRGADTDLYIAEIKSTYYYELPPDEIDNAEKEFARHRFKIRNIHSIPSELDYPRKFSLKTIEKLIR